MAWRIGDLVIRGELGNTQRNSVSGWLEFEDEQGIRLELTGNFVGEMAGKLLRFEAGTRPVYEQADVEARLDSLEVIQIGPIGDVVLRTVEHPRCSEGESPPVDEKPCLSLEWFGQNGRVIVEIIDPTIELLDDKDRPSRVEPTTFLDAALDSIGPDIIRFTQDADDELERMFPREEADDADPYGLFPTNLSRHIQQSVDPSPDLQDESIAGDEGERRTRNWDEVIPGISEATKRMYEQWDEIAHGEKDEPLTTLFDPPISLKQPHQIVDEAEAQKELNKLLARLAECCVALDICEHYTALDSYRLLMEEILPEATIYPQLPGTGFVQHYSTFEYCSACDADFDAEYERLKRDHPPDESL